MPARGSRDHVPAAVLADLLVNGEASRLYQGLVKGKELLLQIQGGVNWPLGDAWTYRGPTLLVLFGLYKPTTSAKAVVDAIGAEVERVARQGVPAAELDRVKTKMKSDYYSGLEMFINRADAIALAQLLGGDASFVIEIPGKIDAVTVADLKRVAAAYLTPANRTWVDRQPAPAAAPQK
jgi:zinc protease